MEEERAVELAELEGDQGEAGGCLRKREFQVWVDLQQGWVPLRIVQELVVVWGQRARRIVPRAREGGKFDLAASFPPNPFHEQFLQLEPPTTLSSSW